MASAPDPIPTSTVQAAVSQLASSKSQRNRNISARKNAFASSPSSSFPRPKGRATGQPSKPTISATTNCTQADRIVKRSISTTDSKLRSGPSPSNVSSPPPSDCVIVDEVSYLGSTSMKDPLSEPEMLRVIAESNGWSEGTVPVRISVPLTSSGIVRLLGAEKSPSAVEIASFPVQRVRFCARGKPNSTHSDCFAISFTHLNPNSISTPTTMSGSGVTAEAKRQAPHQCHVFKCQTAEAAGRALMHFASAFRNAAPRTQSCPSTPIAGGPMTALPTPSGEEATYEFEALLEVKEWDEATQSYSSYCPVERNCLKLRKDRERRLSVMLSQRGGPRPLRVRKCFGLLLAPGRNLRHSDMHLLDMLSSGGGQSSQLVYVTEASWSPTTFDVLNTETPRDTRVFMTVAVDVILEGIDEPVRFSLECRARVLQHFECFWHTTRRAISELFTLTTKMDGRGPPPSVPADVDGGFTHASTDRDPSSGQARLRVVKLESTSDRQRSTSAVRSNINSSQMPTQLIHPAEEGESDSDEPLLSGSGEVNRVCSEDILTEWRSAIARWKEDPATRPAELNTLIHDGVPDVLRGEVWQLLAKTHTDEGSLVQNYRILLEKECPSEQVIIRDINRTFPAHAYFKDKEGQEALYRISKAYSLYDEEVSYCQGISFLAAALLLHMPEENAFCVLIKVMYDYRFRDLFKLGFDTLHLRFHQLHKLIEDYDNELFVHFKEIGVEPHMFASQWFLTLFTAKFPLQMVFFIVDLFLLEEVNTLFHISLALLQDSKKDLLQLDFEGVLKYFRVTLPRRYRTESSAKELIHRAVRLKISHKRLSKYEKEYRELRQQEMEQLDPVERVERENRRLKETILRLEGENDDMAHELVTSKIELRNKLDLTEDHLESSMITVERRSRECNELQEQCRSLKEEAEHVKNTCRQEIQRLDEEVRRAQSVIEQYKKICTDLGVAFEADRARFEQQKRTIVTRIAGCERCSSAISEWLPTTESPRTRRGQVADTNDSPNGQESAEQHMNGECSGDGGVTTTGVYQVVELMNRLEEREEHISQMELELAQTKLALVESQCQNQDLTHQMMSSSVESHQDSRPAWLKKTISSINAIKEVSTTLKGTTTTGPGSARGHTRSNSSVSVEK